MIRFDIPHSLFLSSLLLLPLVPRAAVPVPGCRDLAESDFRKESLATRLGAGLQEPIHMDFDKTSAGVDIYFTEKAGKVRRYQAATGKVSTLGTLPVYLSGELGLLGIALDPHFQENRFLYLFYTASDLTKHHRVSRFTLVGDSLGARTEKILMNIPTPTEWITGGAIKFDAKGDLWITVGEGVIFNSRNDTVVLAPHASADTRSALGKLLRIHPLPEGGYSIPEGNLFPPGDTAKTLPEIFGMGLYNPVSLSFDPKSGKAAWADFGRDNASPVTDELNLTGAAGNFGWPYFSGPNTVLMQNQSPSNPKAWFAVKGLVDLPAAVPATLPRPQSCPIAGPVYRYAAYPDGPGKLPPQFDGLWFATDFNKGTLDTLAVPDAGPVGKIGRLFSGIKMEHPTDLQIGPDGVLYGVDYAGNYGTTDKTEIVRIVYTGDCVSSVGVARPVLAGAEEMSVTGKTVQVTSPGRYRIRLADVAGRTVFEKGSEGSVVYDLRAMAGARTGVFLLSVRTGNGIHERKIFLDGR